MEKLDREFFTKLVPNICRASENLEKAKSKSLFYWVGYHQHLCSYEECEQQIENIWYLNRG
jgi:hypothetical protein